MDRYQITKCLCNERYPYCVIDNSNGHVLAVGQESQFELDDVVARLNEQEGRIKELEGQVAQLVRFLRWMGGKE